MNINDLGKMLNREPIKAPKRIEVKPDLDAVARIMAQCRDWNDDHGADRFDDTASSAEQQESARLNRELNRR